MADIESLLPVVPEAHEIVESAVADSMKTLRHFAMGAMALIVVIVLVGMIVLVHSQGSDHGATQHALTGITNTLTQDKNAIINSCKAAVGKK
jgi:hypothetical protein